MALLTGRLPFETGVRDEGAPLKAGERLLAQMLRDRGYATGGIVSSGMLRRRDRHRQGVSISSTTLRHARVAVAAARPEDVPAAAAELTAGELRRDGAESEAVAERWLSTRSAPRGCSCFCTCTSRMRRTRRPSGSARSRPTTARSPMRTKSSAVSCGISRRIQLYDQSTIVLVSDHGEGLGDHGEQGHGLFLYDEAIHVPLIIKQAGGADAGRRVADLVQQADIVPTVLDLVKAPVPGNLRGRSLKPLADGTGSGRRSRRCTRKRSYGRNRFGWSALESLTDGTLQYIRAPREELYDLKADPRQRDNIGGRGHGGRRGTANRAQTPARRSRRSAR